SMVVRHHTGLDLAERAGRKLLTIPEFLLALTIDHRGTALFHGNLVRAIERRTKVRRSGDVLTVAAQSLGQLVVPEVFLEQVNRERVGFALRLNPGAPGIVVVHDHDGRQLMLGHRIDLHRGVAEAGVAGDADDRMALVGSLWTDAQLHRRRDSYRIADVGTDRAVLVGTVHDLPGPIAAQLAPRVARDAIAARSNRRLLPRNVALVQKIGELAGNHGRMNGVGVA